nr:DNA/RNA non-specific endonuclease [Microbacterium terrae]
MSADTADAGYDPAFLGPEVPLPVPADGRGIRELRYPRFTVVLDPVRRLAVTTAVNIDGSALRDVPRTGDWRLDERIPASEQAGPEIYARNDLDRGHLVRRRDPGWGEPVTARVATEATFRYPNAAPQVNVFNQSKDLWLGLEDHVLAYAEATDARVSVFTAPVLDADDPRYRGLQVPRRFYKIAAWADDGVGTLQLRSAGFVLDQSDVLRLEAEALAVPPLAAFRTFQAPVADIAALAGVDLGPLASADVLATTTARGGGDWRPLRAAEDISLG